MGFLYERFCADPEAAIADHSNEQVFLSRTLGDLTYWPETWCRSFKRHCLPGGVMNWVRRPAIPEGAKIIVFHGPPHPPEPRSEERRVGESVLVRSSLGCPSIFKQTT